MMHSWFECKVRYDKTLETGIQKKVTEPYLVDALSFTEAEARIIKEITPFINGEFEVSNVKKYKVNEMFLEDGGDKWYKARVNFISLDEKSGVEKKTGSTMLIMSDSLTSALQTLTKGMLGTLADYEIASIAETKIMDIYPYEAVEDGKEEEV